MGDLELSWAAGFFEGEGCVSTGRGRDWMYLVSSITQNNRYPLDRFFHAVEGLGQIYGPYPRKDGNSYYRWTARGRPAWDTMWLLNSYLSLECEKRQKLLRLMGEGTIKPEGGVRLWRESTKHT